MANPDSGGKTQLLKRKCTNLCLITETPPHILSKCPGSLQHDFSGDLFQRTEMLKCWIWQGAEMLRVSNEE